MIEGCSAREHAVNEWKQDGVRPEVLAPMDEWTCSRIDPEKPPPDPLPEELLYLWEWFAQLNLRRPPGAFGVGTITHAELDAWARLHGRHPTPFELHALDLWEAYYQKANQPKAATK